MKAITMNTLRNLKQTGEKFSVLTCYDATFSAAMARAEVEVILIGDSLGMVLQGHTSTLPVTIEDMAYHTAAVARGNQVSLLMADMPFMSYASLDTALTNAALLMRAGAHLVKLEGGAWLAETVTQLTRGGIPVCIHLGLTPQSVNVMGGYRVQGRDDAAAQQLLDDALAVQAAGAVMLLLECVPASLAARVQQALSIPVIGIGAGLNCDGQVLVMHDMLGLHAGKPARFVKDFLVSGDGTIEGAFKAYVQSVKSGQYPAEEHTFQ
ncbi:3-methyl-2-oxobutanoate hydroxymethyltransferase [Perlucidibaca aquatica]|uniref:3-methyl-2-oxobutanoate hydroxymethyltransferase n=1 Tax=Perlucidibaca aquatica TaxID=1852776 RepID=UPI00083B8271|nr:3-methyl-2-oxobutanoate hydroxymethyltransferase [Perlucidibaca aquatica]